MAIPAFALPASFEWPLHLHTLSHFNTEIDGKRVRFERLSIARQEFREKCLRCCEIICKVGSFRSGIDLNSTLPCPSLGCFGIVDDSRGDAWMVTDPFTQTLSEYVNSEVISRYEAWRLCKEAWVAMALCFGIEEFPTKLVRTSSDWVVLVENDEGSSVALLHPLRALLESEENSEVGYAGSTFVSLPAVLAQLCAALLELVDSRLPLRTSGSWSAICRPTLESLAVTPSLSAASVLSAFRSIEPPDVHCPACRLLYCDDFVPVVLPCTHRICTKCRRRGGCPVVGCDALIPRSITVDEDLCDESRCIAMYSTRSAAASTPRIVASATRLDSTVTRGFFGLISSHRTSTCASNADILAVFIEWASSDGAKPLEALTEVAVFVVDDLHPPQRCDDTYVQLWCRTISALCGGDRPSTDACGICVSAGAIPALLSVFDKLTYPTSVCLLAASTLANVSRCRSAQFVTVTIDCLQRLFATMDAHGTSAPISGMLCSVVGNLAGNPDNVRRIMASGGLRRLSAAANAHFSTPSVMESVIGALGNLATNPEAKRQLGTVEWIGRVCSAMDGAVENVGLQEVSIWTFGNLCGDEVVETNLVLAGCLSRISAAMSKHVGSPLLQENACVTLGNLASSSKHKLQIVNCGLHSRIVAAMDVHGRIGGVQEAACVALGNLATHPFNQARLMKAGVLEPLYRCFDAFTATETIVDAVLSVLVNLAASRDNRPAIVHSGGYFRIMKALELYTFSQAVVMVALCALKSFVAVSACRAMMRQGFSPQLLRSVKEHHYDSVHIQSMCDDVVKLLDKRPQPSDAVGRDAMLAHQLK